MISIRQNWRVILLLFLLLISGIVLFVPGVGLGSPHTSGPTNLQFGLDLSGGTRIRAPLVGLTAEGVDVTTNNQAEIEQSVAEDLEQVTRSDVQARPSLGTIEVFIDVPESEFAAALDNNDVSYTEIRRGVTEPTRVTAVDVIRKKIDESGLAGGTVQQVTTSTGDHFVVIEVPNRNRSEVESLVSSRGVVEIVATYPVQSNGETENQDVTVLTQEDIANVGQAQGPTQGLPQPHVPVVLTDEAADRFASQMRERGFTGEGIQACRYQTNPDDAGYCLYTVLDGQIVYAASMSDGLAQDIERGDFVVGKNFVMTTNNMSDARQLQLNLQAGALPAPLDLQDRGTSFFLAPSLAENFKIYSLLTGIIAVLAVVMAVFIRYREAIVAGPMIVTALSEVVLLLGFAAVVGLALDLSHIAGLIAVIGTGVDDLIIIADEVMAEGSVSSGRVFHSRFRKAFWVIGAAAATTVIAMSPLAILSLGDLRGFAIVTILGVLIGVFITRPAYGDILRMLMTRF